MKNSAGIAPTASPIRTLRLASPSPGAGPSPIGPPGWPSAESTNLQRGHAVAVSARGRLQRGQVRMGPPTQAGALDDPLAGGVPLGAGSGSRLLVCHA